MIYSNVMHQMMIVLYSTVTQIGREREREREIYIEREKERYIYDWMYGKASFL